MAIRHDRAARHEQALRHGQARQTQARPLSDILRKTIKDAFAKQGFAATELVTRWPEIVGPEIAAHCRAGARSSGRARTTTSDRQPGTLVLRVEGPTAIEIQHLSRIILERVNRFFGWQAVGRICGCGRRRSAAARSRQPPAPDPAAAERIAAALTEISDEKLRAGAGAARRRGQDGRDGHQAAALPINANLPDGRHCHNDGRQCQRRAGHAWLGMNRAMQPTESSSENHPSRLCLWRQRAGPERGPRRPRQHRAGRRRPHAQALLNAGRAARRHGARRRKRAGHHHRIRLDDLPALRDVPRDHLSGAQEALHRHRQGALHLPRIPARPARAGGLPCWRAAPARTNTSR